MNFDTRIDQIENKLNIIACPECDRSAEAQGDDDQILEGFFAPCAKCGRQKTFVELAEIATGAE